jgi:hypothetical protein
VDLERLGRSGKLDRMSEPTGKLPPEAERLLATAPDEFVAERGRVARELRDAGRTDDASAVAALRKPSAVVSAVNRAARDRPQAALDAAAAAERVQKTQLSGKAERYREALSDLDRALGLLAEVAVARLSRDKPANDAMRRRVNELLKAAVANERTRAALVRGALVEELEAGGFSPFEGVTVERPRRRGRAASSARESRAAEKRKARAKELRDELARARTELTAAQRRVDEAVRERDRAERSVESLQTKLDRL